MEGKLVSNKSFFAVVLILSVVQLTTAAKLYPPQMLLGKPLSCPYYGEYCDGVHPCCPGTQCTSTFSAGTCVHDPYSPCRHLGQPCGFWAGSCCGKSVCTNDGCSDLNSNNLAFSII
ncbi:uncharacterized protein [Spinacia oleracea]|uniref:Granulins domain-containing protein n=1 Tax=Spinacia oleracea TaxID=3562 RepID=A0A9R0ITG0_SPIOL|nr:uncharacterized protein LOC110794587 [Spinacia oleracea]